MKLLPYDKLHFLEPAHGHDLAEVANLIDLPLSTSGHLPNEIRALLPDLREATSIVFASLNRLNKLLSQRLERLTILGNETKKSGATVQQYSEPAYFTFQNQVMTEAHYMVIEALPDWKHKATRFEYECARWGIVLEIDLARTDAEAEFAKWFSNLRDEVQEWKRVAEGVEAPDFDKAVVDLMAMDAKNKEANGDSTSPTMDFEDGDMQEIKKVDSGVHLGE